MQDLVQILLKILDEIAGLSVDIEPWQLNLTIFSMMLLAVCALFKSSRKGFLSPEGKRFKELSNRAQSFEQEFELARTAFIDHNQVVKWQSSYRDVFEKLADYDTRQLRSSLIRAINAFYSLEKIVNASNAAFITAESKKHDSLFGNLDERQREACVSDEVSTLVIAGAGSGKTRTIQKKVEYLINTRGIAPEDILLLSFTNKAADEMTHRLQESMPTCKMSASTFHKFGLSIIKAKRGDGYDVADAKLCSDTILRALSPDFMTEDECRGALKFFAFYLNSEPEDESKFANLGEYISGTSAANFRTIRGAVDSKITFAGESVKSFEELEIANWLYLNGIDYQYELKYDKPYQKSSTQAFRTYKPDFYLPKYNIWIEHFGIDKDGMPPPYFSAEAKKAYIDGMEWKRKLHKQNETILVESYSWWHKEGELTGRLWEKLKEHGVTRNGVNPKAVWTDFVNSNKDSIVREFARLVSTFISLAKSNRYTSSNIKELENKYECCNLSKARLKAFLDQASILYQRYEDVLRKGNAVDFHDMINEATDLIEADKTLLHKFRYVIVDEFQDISVGRKDLLKAIVSATGAKLFCVGDDWQSIYRFAGSDISIFTDFDQHFGYTRCVKLENTYRNSQELLKVAGDFVMKNRSQIKKKLKSSLSYDRPVVCVPYSASANIGQALINALEDIAISAGGQIKEVLLLGRHNHEASLPCTVEGITAIKDMETYRWDKHPELRLSFMTVHKAKGIEADYVILLNFCDDLLGFPNKIGDDPILSLLLARKEDVPFAEERRVFYVALTRTRTRVYILMPENGYSIFFDDLPKEIKECGANNLSNLALCPKCKTGRLILRKSKINDGEEFYGCANYPRCDYALPIQRVPITAATPRCSCGGFLVPVHNPKNGQDFLGCTEYNRLTSCNHIRRALNTRELPPLSDRGGNSLQRRLNIRCTNLSIIPLQRKRDSSLCPVDVV